MVNEFAIICQFFSYSTRILGSTLRNGCCFTRNTAVVEWSWLLTYI